MPDPTAPPDPDTGVDRDGTSTVGAPRWVKVLGAVALVLAVLVVSALLGGVGDHGPGRHTSSAVETAPHTALSAVPTHGEQP